MHSEPIVNTATVCSRPASRGIPVLVVISLKAAYERIFPIIFHPSSCCLDCSYKVRSSTVGNVHLHPVINHYWLQPHYTRSPNCSKPSISNRRLRFQAFPCFEFQILPHIQLLRRLSSSQTVQWIENLINVFHLPPIAVDHHHVSPSNCFNFRGRVLREPLSSFALV